MPNAPASDSTLNSSIATRLLAVRGNERRRADPDVPTVLSWLFAALVPALVPDFGAVVVRAVVPAVSARGAPRAGGVGGVGVRGGFGPEVAGGGGGGGGGAG